MGRDDNDGGEAEESDDDDTLLVCHVFSGIMAIAMRTAMSISRDSTGTHRSSIPAVMAMTRLIMMMFVLIILVSAGTRLGVVHPLVMIAVAIPMVAAASVSLLLPVTSATVMSVLGKSHSGT